MILVHRRSVEAQMRRSAHKFIATLSYHDQERAETVCTIDSNKVTSFLQATYPEYPISVDCTMVEKGEVLSDSRGKGSFQTVGR